MFSCEFWEISKNIFFTQHLWATTYVELIKNAWWFENAKQHITNENVNEVLEQNSELQCHCNGQCFLFTQEILAKIEIDDKTFANDLKPFQEKGRQKDLNIMLHGPADCGKLCLLKPVCNLFPNVFMDPTSSTFVWMGVEKSSLIFLNDLRWAANSREEYWLASFSKPFKRLNCVTTSTNERKLLPYQSDQTHTDICNHYWQIEYWEKTVSEAQCHVILEKLSWCHSGKTAFDSLIKFPEGKKRHSRLIDSFQNLYYKKKTKNYTPDKETP